MECNFADMFEAIVDLVPDRTACVIVGDGRRTYAELEDRVNRFAHHLQAAGVGTGGPRGHVRLQRRGVGRDPAGALQDPGRPREHQLPLRRERARVPLHERRPRRGGRTAGVRAARWPRSASTCRSCAHVVVAADASGASTAGLDVVDYEESVAAGSPARDFAPRSGDDIHIIYTGGTTGMPKGVMWRQEDIFYALCGGIDAYSNEKLAAPLGALREGRRGRRRDGQLPDGADDARGRRGHR